MSRGAFRKFRAALVVTALAPALVAPAAAADDFQVTQIVYTNANPAKADGACPTTVQFFGQIAYKGVVSLWQAKKNGEIKYTFIRSDGAQGPVKTISVNTNYNVPYPAQGDLGAENVNTTWTLGGANLPQYAGWVAIKILSPNAMEGPKAAFEIHCKSPARPRPAAGNLPSKAQ